jgi:hypothetical protein
MSRSFQTNLCWVAVAIALLAWAAIAFGQTDAGGHVLLSTEFEADDWYRAWGASGVPGNCDLVSSEQAFGGAGRSLRVTVKKGSNWGTSLAYRFARKPGGEPGEIYFRYVRFELTSLKTYITVQSMDEQGAMKVSMEQGGKMDLAWAQLEPRDHFNLALALVAADEPEDHALAAFYLLLAQKKERGEERLSKDGEYPYSFALAKEGYLPADSPRAKGYGRFPVREAGAR